MPFKHKLRDDRASRVKTPLSFSTPFQCLKRGESLTCGIGQTLTYGIGVTQTDFEAVEGEKKRERHEDRRGNGTREKEGMGAENGGTWQKYTLQEPKSSQIRIAGTGKKP